MDSKPITQSEMTVNSELNMSVPPPYTDTEKTEPRITERLQTINSHFNMLHDTTDAESSPVQPQVSADTSNTPQKCQVHGPSSSPMLEKHMGTPGVQESIQVLLSVVSDAVENGTCLRFAIQSVAEESAVVLREFKTKKRSGHWSREEKKALKAEAKVLMKDAKKSFRKMWKSSSKNSS